METSSQIFIFGGSLAAILALAGLAALMKLGGQPVLTSNAAAAKAAGEVQDGYEPVEIALDKNGAAALLRDKEGRVMLIKRHGTRFAGRILASGSSARAEADTLIVDCGETRFGMVKLALGDTYSWAETINGLGSAHNA